jgi:hypothetical protein
MRLDDLRRNVRDETDIPAEVERELEVLDAALRGEEVPPGMEGIEVLVSDLRAERQEPEPRFEEKLDAWAAAGFPRGKGPRTRAGRGARANKGGFFSQLSPNGPRGWSPVAATAAVVVVVGVSLTQIGDFGGDDPTTTGTTQEVSGETSDESADVDTDTAGGGAAAPDTPENGDDATSLEEALAPGALKDQGQEAEAGVTRDQESTFVAPNAQNLGTLDRASRSGNSRGQEKRRVDREAQLTLAAPAGEVADVNDQVIDVVEGANGIVKNSRVTGTDEAARATLEVEVPTASLDNTLASLSELANVRSRTEQSVDITRSYVTAKDRLVGLRASRDNLAMRIREATTDAEVTALQAQLAGVNRQIADAKNELANVENRAQFSTVTIVITSEGAGTSEDEDDGWSFGDALDDAGKVLEVGAGVALISAAVLLPLSIIAAIAYFVVSAANRRARERTLDE